MTDYTYGAEEQMSFSDGLGKFAYGKLAAEEVTNTDSLANKAIKLCTESATIADAGVVRDVSRTFRETLTNTDTVKKKPGKLAAENQAYVDTATAVNLYFTAKFLTGDTNTIEAAVEDYLASHVGASKDNIVGISCVPISSTNFGVLIVHS